MAGEGKQGRKRGTRLGGSGSRRLLLGCFGGLLLSGLGLLLGGSLAGGLSLGAVRRRPEREVVPEKLHDEGGVAVRFLREGVELRNGVVKRLLGKVAGAVGRVQDLVVEDREVEGQAEANGVRRRELCLGDIRGRLGGWLVRLCTY